MITDNIKDFTLLFSRCNINTKDKLLDNLLALSNYIENYKPVKKTSDYGDFNALYAAKLFGYIHGYEYYFTQDVQQITKRQHKYKTQVTIIFKALNDFCDNPKEEREALLQSLTNMRKTNPFNKIKSLFTRK